MDKNDFTTLHDKDQEIWQVWKKEICKLRKDFTDGLYQFSDIQILQIMFLHYRERLQDITQGKKEQ